VIFLLVPLSGFAAGWLIAFCYLVLRNAPYGLYPDRRFVMLLEFLHRGTMVAAIIACLILQGAFLLMQPPVVAAASLIAAAAGAFVVYCFRRLIARP